MNIQTTSSPGLPTLSRASGLVDKKTHTGVSINTPDPRRPTRLVGRSDVHATFVYSSAAQPQPALTGRQVDVYV